MADFTPSLGDRICEIVRNGNFIESAASDVGVTSRTIRNWRRWGLEGREPYVNFARALGAAEVASENVYVLSIRRAAMTDWKAAAWLLEHRFNSRWGFKAQVTHTVEEEFKRMLDVAERVLGSDAASRLFVAITDGGDSPGETPGDLGDPTTTH